MALRLRAGRQVKGVDAVAPSRARGSKKPPTAELANLIEAFCNKICQSGTSISVAQSPLTATAVPFRPFSRLLHRDGHTAEVERNFETYLAALQLQDNAVGILQIEGRATDHLKHVGGCRLLLQRLS